MPRARVPLAAALLTAASCTHTGPDATGGREPSETHQLTIVHPGDPKSRPIPVALEQIRDARGEPTEYRTWVDSVICRDAACEVVRVRLVWNALGQFQRYEVEPGEDLTKLDHEPFDAADHAKLLRILKDRDSPLKEVTKEGLVPKSPDTPRHAAAVGGVSGATVLTLRSTVVVGAGYTCYDLWHWANGEVADIVRDLSGETFSPRALRRFLIDGDDHAKRFALTQLARRGATGPETVSAVIAGAKDADDALTEPILATLRAAAADPAAYHDALADLVANGTGGQRVAILTDLARSSQAPPAGFLDQLSESLPEFESYYEIHLFLNLMQQRNPGSEVVARNTAPLLKHEKFFAARRAYWYLSEQELPETLQAQVDAFRKRHADRL